MDIVTLYTNLALWADLAMIIIDKIWADYYDATEIILLPIIYKILPDVTLKLVM